jgi:hypothetical protein
MVCWAELTAAAVAGKNRLNLKNNIFRHAEQD